ncbi:MAG: hypothetical protein ABIF87_08290 [Pseudomonadota bacterium]
MELPSALGDEINFWTWWIVIPIAFGIIGRFLLEGNIGVRIAVLPTIPIITILALIRIESWSDSGGEEIAWLILYGVVWILFATAVLITLEVIRKILCYWHERAAPNKAN